MPSSSSSSRASNALISRYLSCLESISEMCHCENQVKDNKRQSTKSNLSISSKVDDQCQDYGLKASLTNRLMNNMTLPLHETIFNKSGKSTTASEQSTPVGEVMTGRSNMTSCESNLSVTQDNSTDDENYNHLGNQLIQSRGHNERIMTNKNINSTPSACSGYMAKLGQSFRSWKVRYFVLENGVITCYTGKSSSSVAVGLQSSDQNAAGEFQVGSHLILRGYKVTSPAPNQLLISIPYHHRSQQNVYHLHQSITEDDITTTTITTRQLLIKAMNEIEFLKWEQAINEHIQYINESTYLCA